MGSLYLKLLPSASLRLCVRFFVIPVAALREVVHGVLEDAESGAFGLEVFACPTRVMGAVNESFGMWHQSETVFTES